jgi:hypothetical protein
VNTGTVDSLSEFAKVLLAHRKDLFTQPKESGYVQVEHLYCSSAECGGFRRAMLDFEGAVPANGLKEAFEQGGLTAEVLLDTITPALFTLSCLQCDAEYTVVIYRRDKKPSLIILPSMGRGIGSPHTPAGVAYYLDQAARSHSSGANTAAIGMFRSAVEWILEEHGYSQRMLGPKLQALENDAKTGTAPVWVGQLQPDVLPVLKNLGNTATHTNEGDISKQDAMDADVYRATEACLLEIVEFAYERPAIQQQRLLLMKAAIPPRVPK